MSVNVLFCFSLISHFLDVFGNQWEDIFRGRKSLGVWPLLSIFTRGSIERIISGLCSLFHSFSKCSCLDPHCGFPSQSRRQIAWTLCRNILANKTKDHVKDVIRCVVTFLIPKVTICTVVQWVAQVSWV